MKKLLLLSFILTFAFTAFAQGEQKKESKFPYEKILKMSDKELKDARFKFDDEMNQWTLTKLNGFNQTLAVLDALSNYASNYIPHVNDYRITIQKGLEAVASIEVAFYDNNIYHEIITFANDNGSNLLETTSGKVTKTQFNYENYSFVLSRETVGQSAIIPNWGYVTSKDQSYGVFSFVIFTGEKPYSKWLEKEAAKQAKRDAKGKKKQSAADLM